MHTGVNPKKQRPGITPFHDTKRKKCKVGDWDGRGSETE